MTIARIMDANANRAREALRVLEDVARLVLDDAELSLTLKTIRHELRAALDGLPAGRLEASRDIGGDVGTSHRTASELRRDGVIGIVEAGGKRLGESLRVLEEAAKTLDPDVAMQLEAVRYRVYDVEARLLRRLGSGRGAQWRLCVLLTESLCRRPWRDVLEQCVRGGVDCIQVREKQLSAGRLAERCRTVIGVARPAGIAVIVNDRPDVAIAVGADGVHLGQDDLAIADVRRLAGRTLVVGVSTHDPDEARAAVTSGADYCGVGCMFPSATRPDRAPAGPQYLRWFVEHHPNTPHLAIGGITPQHLDQLVAAGAKGVAMSSAICGAESPAEVVRVVLRSLDRQDSPRRHGDRTETHGSG